MKLLKEPLVHFVALGALLFGAYAWLHGNSADDRTATRQVRIAEGDVQWLKETWSRQWQREPTREELHGLVTEFLKEELLAREARAMGLDENDAIVRRRLAQKLEFLVQDTSRLAEPSEDDLRRFYAANSERFTDAARVSFTQVYFSPKRRKDAAADAHAALADLSRGDSADVSRLGDRLLLEAGCREADEQTVSGQFGKEFARAAFALQPGAWHGPIESGYGLHLVRVTELKPAKQREFGAVRSQVLEYWSEQRQREVYEKYFAGLLTKYDVVVDENVRPLVWPILVAKGGQP